MFISQENSIYMIYNIYNMIYNLMFISQENSIYMINQKTRNLVTFWKSSLSI